MGVKPDHWIRQMAADHQMIAPFAERSSKGQISFGLSSYGYDFRIADEYKIPSNATLIDPKNFNGSNFNSFKGETLNIPAGSFVLGRSVEYFKIPRNILTICNGKSTYARSGVIVNVTPFEPEWEGYATLSIVNAGRSPVRIYSNEGIAQLIFLEATDICEISYADKKGKYQAQKEIVHSKVH
jgi:dCTP deaminase